MNLIFLYVLTCHSQHQQKIKNKKHFWLFHLRLLQFKPHYTKIHLNLIVSRGREPFQSNLIGRHDVGVSLYHISGNNLNHLSNLKHMKQHHQQDFVSCFMVGFYSLHSKHDRSAYTVSTEKTNVFDLILMRLDVIMYSHIYYHIIIYTF